MGELSGQDWDPGPASKETPRQGDFDQDILRVCQDLSRYFGMRSVML